MSLRVYTIAGFVFAAALPGKAQIIDVLTDRTPTISAREWSKKVEPQASGFVPLRDASNHEFATEMRWRQVEEPVGKGSISVRELSQPMDRKSRKLIEEAERLIVREETDKALDVLATAVKDQAAAPYAYSLMGAEHLRRGEVELAHQELEAAAGLLPSYSPNHYHLALALARLHREEEALTEARRALQLDPARAEFRYVLGVLLLRTGRKEEAEFHLKMAAAEIPGARRLLAQYTGQ